MIVSRYSKKFHPIEIILESEDEVANLRQILSCINFAERTPSPFTSYGEHLRSFCKELEDCFQTSV